MLSSSSTSKMGSGMMMPHLSKYRARTPIERLGLDIIAPAAPSRR
jgi:hypothetical protein